jgi:hypothetical protein
MAAGRDGLNVSRHSSKPRGAALSLDAEIDFQGRRTAKLLGEALPPFDHQDGTFRAAFVEPKASHLAGRLLEIALFSEPVEVDVKQRPHARFVFLNERERRARDGGLRRDSKRAGHRARKKGLARAEIAREEHEIARS